MILPYTLLAQRARLIHAGLVKYNFEPSWALSDICELIILAEYDLDIPANSPLLNLTSLLHQGVNLGEKFVSDSVVGRFGLAGKRWPAATAIDFSSWDDAQFEELFPFRTAMDKAIRRTRLIDVRALFRDLLNEDFNYVLSGCVGLDYIFSSNICYAWLIDPQAVLTLGKVDAFRDPEKFNEVAKFVSSLVKTAPVTRLIRQRYGEISALVGYRNPPYPGFDVFAEAEDLAKGGEPHGYNEDSWRVEFSDALKSITVYPDVLPPYVSFPDYVRGLSWVTSGASDVGKVEWSFQGDSGHFKARKNFVPYVYDIEALVASGLESQSQVNKTLVKAELAKLRLAVAGDIVTYLQMSWLGYLTGKSYKLWQGCTLEETFDQQSARMLALQRELTNGWSMPFDFSAFDHQPTTWEIVQICRAWFHTAEVGRSSVELEAIRAMSARVLASFSAAALVTTQGEKRVSVPVSGGLGSGLFVTSPVGNIWNMVVTAIVKKMMLRCGVSGYNSFLRGDDSAITSGSSSRLLLFRLGFAAVNAIGADGKFAIHRGESEFLRVWFTRDATYGFVWRAVAGLTQSKPWNSTPWTSEAELESVFSSLTTIERRLGRDFSDWRLSFARGWSRRRKLSIDYLRLPRLMGGFGLLPFLGRVPSQPIPKFVLPKLNFSLGPYASSATQLRFPDFKLADSESLALTQGYMQHLAASDDVQGFSRIARRLGGNIYARLNPKWIRLDASAFMESWRRVDYLAGLGPSELKRQRRPVDIGASNYWQQLKELASVRSIRPAMLFSAKYPQSWLIVRSLERKGFHRAQALDYVFASITLAAPLTCNPEIAHFVVDVLYDYMAAAPYADRTYHNQAFYYISLLGQVALSRSVMARQLYAY